jgi:hypothetical protein
MQPRDWFGVAVRVAALVFLVFALFDLYYVFGRLLNLETTSKLPLSSVFAAVAFYAIVAAAGMLGADQLVNLSYGAMRRD